ncbi:hypothetical protein EBZ80_22135, partial [bacterium]|nr:hypothetical protein [bacterium]
MGSIGYRQKGDSGPLYNPERDYAYITPTLMVRAIENLDFAARTDEAADWYVQHNNGQFDLPAIIKSAKLSGSGYSSGML